MKFPKNMELFEELRALNLPVGEYLVIASGSLGIRQLREIKDVDLKVTDELWTKLVNKYETFYENDVMKLRISENIEAMCDASFAARGSDGPKAVDQIREAEIIDGIPFENIQTTLAEKRKSNKEKSINDVKLIEDWLMSNSSEAAE